MRSVPQVFLHIVFMASVLMGGCTPCTPMFHETPATIHPKPPHISSVLEGGAPDVVTDSEDDDFVYPCPATPGEWTSCTIDRHLASSYVIPDMPPLAPDIRDPAVEPSVQASIGNLAGHTGDGLVFSEFPATLSVEEGGSNPGYLCVDAVGAWGPCPAELDLPNVPGQIMALALEKLDANDSPDMLVVSVGELGVPYMNSLMNLYPNGTSVPVRLHFYSQERTAGDALPHWVDKTAEAGLAEMTLQCAPTNVQAVDLNHDNVPEIVLGGVVCPPHAFTWEGEHLVYKPTWLPYDIGTNTGVFTSPREDGLGQNLFLISYDGFDRNDAYLGGSSCWRGEVNNWTKVRCPGMGDSPMGFALFDPDRNGLFEVATSDTHNDVLCKDSAYAAPEESIACFEASWMLPESNHTLQSTVMPETGAVTRHNVSWAVNAWEDKVVYVQGYEHAFEPAPDSAEDIPWTAWSQQLHVYRFSDYGAHWERVHNPVFDADVQERGLVGPMDFNGDGCADLMPLPVGLTPMRMLVDGTCAPGTQEVEFRVGNMGAYGAKVVMVGGDSLRQATMVTSGGGFAGFSPPLKSIPPWVERIEVLWTSGDTTTVERSTTTGRFPDVIRP